MTDTQSEAPGLREALECYLKAQCRMRDKWAEGDEKVKDDLWQRLHACEDPARAALASDTGERET